jgi:hypothetical protein
MLVEPAAAARIPGANRFRACREGANTADYPTFQPIVRGLRLQAHPDFGKKRAALVP